MPVTILDTMDTKDFLKKIKAQFFSLDKSKEKDNSNSMSEAQTEQLGQKSEVEGET